MTTKPMSGVARQLEEAISQLHEAQKLLRDLQGEFTIGGVIAVNQPKLVDCDKAWHALEAIDDRLHDALGALGD